LALVLVGVVQRHDVGVRQPGRRLDLALEAGHGVGVGQTVRQDQLEGDQAVHQLLPGPEHLAHAAGPDRLQQHERADAQVQSAALQ
jgi:hypothetical protein